MNRIKKEYKQGNGRRWLMMAVLCLFGFCLLAQQPRTGTARQTKSKVYLLHADVLKKNKQNPDAQILVGDVEFRHDSIYMYCDSAYFYEKTNSLEAFANVRMVQGTHSSFMATICSMTVMHNWLKSETMCVWKTVR